MIEAENIKLHRSAIVIKLRHSRTDVTSILSTLQDRAEKMMRDIKCLYLTM